MMQRVNLDISEDIWREAKAEAALSGQTLREFVERALKAAIENTRRIRLSL